MIKISLIIEDFSTTDKRAGVKPRVDNESVHPTDIELKVLEQQVKGGFTACQDMVKDVAQALTAKYKVS